MRRFPPVPIALSQLRAVLPDGAVDPAATSDCGETALAAVFDAATGLSLSPGSIRQALGLPPTSGVTSAADLARFRDAVGFRGSIESHTGARLQSACRRHLSRGRWVILLGYWDGPSELHWVVAYGWHPAGVWVMDPWPGELRLIPWASVSELGAGQQVTIRSR